MDNVNAMWADHLFTMRSAAFELDVADSDLCYCNDDDCWLDHM